MQPHTVPAPAPALPLWSHLCPNTLGSCADSSALCLIKIESLLEPLQSAKTSKERLVKLQDYLQTQGKEIFFYCHNWKAVPACHGRNMCKELFYLPMFCPALKNYPSLQIHIPSSSLPLWQPWGSASPLQPLQLSSTSFNCWQYWWILLSSHTYPQPMPHQPP